MSTKMNPKASTFRMVLRELEKSKKEDPWAWKYDFQYICHIITKLASSHRISGQARAAAISYVMDALAPAETLALWLAAQGYTNVYNNIDKVNDHRIEWVKRIIKELS